MCGIAGILQIEPQQTAEASQHLQQQLKQMNRALQHRGPDGEGTWVEQHGLIGLAHRRLAIIDLSAAGEQPMEVKGLTHHRYYIVHNGEIYNYLEIKKLLADKGYSFTTKTDTEVIAAAYDCWQENCLQYFDGMFAFALWDEEKKELFAARDRFGEKPFFYCTQQQQFFFASEMKALWAAGVERHVNPSMLFNFLTLGYTGHPQQPGDTFYSYVQQLPPATYLKYSIADKQLSLRKYWEINAEQPLIDISETDAIDTFKELFSTSVQRRLRSDVSLGSSLSGGLDSSSIVATMHSMLSNSFTSFTAVFPGFAHDESAYAEKIASQFQTTHLTTTMSVNDLVTDWEKLCYHQETPFGSASIYAQYKVYELAAQHGVKVLLDGQGADEILAGYPKFYKWYWQELYAQKKLNSSQEHKAAKALGIKEKFGLANKMAALFPGLAGDVLKEIKNKRALSRHDIAPDFIRLQQKKTFYTTPEKFTLNNVLHFHTFSHGLEELLKFADRNAMAHGREIRLPFLSHELVAFIFSLPPHFKIKNGWTKWLLRQVMQSTLPEDIVWRKNKIGFEPPQQKWMQNKQLREMIFTAKEKLVQHKILHPKILQIDSKAHAANAASGYDWRYLTAAYLFQQ